MSNDSPTLGKVRDLVAEDSLQNKIMQQIAEAKAKEADARAKMIAEKVMRLVEYLRAARVLEKKRKADLKAAMKAVKEYEASGNLDVLKKAKLI